MNCLMIPWQHLLSKLHSCHIMCIVNTQQARLTHFCIAAPTSPQFCRKSNLVLGSTLSTIKKHLMLTHFSLAHTMFLLTATSSLSSQVTSLPRYFNLSTSHLDWLASHRLLTQDLLPYMHVLSPFIVVYLVSSPPCTFW
jgi:hypothetical protein